MKDQIKKLAQQMDEKAEDINAHDFVITHRALAILCVKEIGIQDTLHIFEALAREGGLSYLTGICGREPKGGNILDRNNIPDDWSDWEIPSGEIK